MKIISFLIGFFVALAFYALYILWWIHEEGL